MWGWCRSNLLLPQWQVSMRDADTWQVIVNNLVRWLTETGLVE
jgi:hypothetical protein